jgi:hypothetical protein
MFRIFWWTDAKYLKISVFTSPIKSRAAKSFLARPEILRENRLPNTFEFLARLRPVNIVKASGFL